MKLLRFRRVMNIHRYENQVDIILAQCKKAGYVISRADAIDAWEEYSSTMCTGWMTVSEHSDPTVIVNIIKPYVDVLDVDGSIVP